MPDLIANRIDRYVAFDRVNRPYLSWQLEQFAPFLGRRILEIGCGVGSITELLGVREFIRGIEIEPDIFEVANARFPDSARYAFLRADFMALDPDSLNALRDERFDSIVCINVLEHIEDDAGAVARMAELLPPGGILALLVPAHQMLYGSYDALDGHFRRYGRGQLGALLERSGLVVERLRYFNSIGAIGWWVNYRLLRRTIHGEGEFGLMNRLVPALRRVEGAVAPPFGLSVVAVARKPR